MSAQGAKAVGSLRRGSCGESPLIDKNQRHVGLIITLAALLTALSAGIFWVLDRIERQENKRLGSSLETVLKTTDQALRIWAEQTEIDAAVLAEDDRLRSSVRAQLRKPRHFRDLARTDALRNIRRLLRSPMRQYGDLGEIARAQALTTELHARRYSQTR